MRDRLSQLQELSDASANMDCAESTTNSDSFSNVDVGEELTDNTPALEDIFSQAQDVHRDIQLIRLEVKRLREQNSRVLHSAHLDATKTDSNAIVSDIKARAEGVLMNLRDMDALARELETKYGANAAATRIARTQYACLSNGFRDTMFDYNKAEMSHRENYKSHIQRQMEIVGKHVTGKEVEDMIETGEWNVFSENILVEGRTARSAMNEIESRHRGLLELESRIQSIHEIFLDVAILVEEQGPMSDTILVNVQATHMGIEEGIIKLERANRLKNNPFKKLFKKK